MDESECVEELERGAGVEELRLVTRRAAGQRTPVAEGGAEPLSTGRNEAVERGEELRQRRLLGCPGVAVAGQDRPDSGLDATGGSE